MWKLEQVVVSGVELSGLVSHGFCLSFGVSPLSCLSHNPAAFLCGRTSSVIASRRFLGGIFLPKNDCANNQPSPSLDWFRSRHEIMFSKMLLQKCNPFSLLPNGQDDFGNILVELQACLKARATVIFSSVN